MSRLTTAVRETVGHNRLVLRRWDLSSLVAGSFIGSLASVVVNLMLTIHVYQATGSSAIAVSALFVITFLPNLLIAPLCSGLADRWNRRLLLGACGLSRAALCALLLAAWPLPVLLVLAFSITSVNAIAKPARYALAAQLVTGQQRVALNSLLMIMATSAGVIGGAVTGLLTSVSGRAVFGVMAALSVVGALLDMVRFRDAPAPLYMAPDTGAGADRATTADPGPRGPGLGAVGDGPGHGEAPPAARGPSLPQRLLAGWRLVRYTPALLALTVATTLLWFGLGVQEPLLVVFVDRVLEAPPATYAYLATVGSIGGLLGAAIATPLAANPPMAARSFSVGLILAGLCFVAFAASGGSVAIAFLLFFAFSASYGVSNVIDEYLEQEMSPDHLRATVISTIGAIGTAGYLLGGALTGFAASTIGAAATAAGVGGVIVVAGVYALLTMRLPDGTAG